MKFIALTSVLLALAITPSYADSGSESQPGSSTAAEREVADALQILSRAQDQGCLELFHALTDVMVKRHTSYPGTLYYLTGFTEAQVKAGRTEFTVIEAYARSVGDPRSGMVTHYGCTRYNYKN